MQRRVVITGLGVVAPTGTGREDFWNACVAGRSGIRRVTRFDATPLPSQIAGEVPHFDPEQLGLTRDEVFHLDRSTQFALAAANLALQDAALTSAPGDEKQHSPIDAYRHKDALQQSPYTLSEEEHNRMGVYMGSAMSDVEEGEKLWVQLIQRHTTPDILMSDDIPASLLMTNASATSIAAHHQLHGPCTVISTGCSAGSDAIGQAFWTIQEGRADRMLAGGTDSAISYIGLDVFCVIGALSTRYNETPPQASRPYDQNRDGFVMAEGAGVILLEERTMALARDAHIYAEIMSFASNSNAHHMTALPADGAPLQHLMTQALSEARITTEQLDYINSHGSSTPSNEVAETAAYKAIFGQRAYFIPISATKSMIGHTQGAASAIETVVTALVLDQQCIPPTINQEQCDSRCDLDYVPNRARPAAVNVALTHSSGFGGVNSALILARPDWINQHDR